MAFEEDYHQTSFEVTCQVLQFKFSELNIDVGTVCTDIKPTRTGRRVEAQKVISLFQRTMSGQTVSEVTQQHIQHHFPKENIETTVNWQVHCAVPLQRFRLRGALKWYRAPFKSTPYLAVRSKKSLDQVISYACSFKACKLVLEQTEGFHWETCSQVAGPLVSNVGGPATIQLSCPSYLSVFLQVSHFRCTRSSSSSQLNTGVERAKMSCAMGRRTRQVNYFHHFILQQHSPRGSNPPIHQWSRISTKAPSVDCIDSSLLQSWRSECLAGHNCSFQGSTFYHDRRLGHGRMLMLMVMVVYGDQIFLEATTVLSKAQH